MAKVFRIIKSDLPPNEIFVTRQDFYNLFELTIKMMSFKYDYEKAVAMKKEKSCADKNLNDVKVYSKFLSTINKTLKDRDIRQLAIEFIKQVKNHNFKKESIKQSYATILNWFSDSTYSGKLFRKNFAKANNPNYVDFEYLFDVMQHRPIIEGTKEYTEIKETYNKIQKEYTDLIK